MIHIKAANLSIISHMRSANVSLWMIGKSQLLNIRKKRKKESSLCDTPELDGEEKKMSQSLTMISKIDAYGYTSLM